MVRVAKGGDYHFFHCYRPRSRAGREFWLRGMTALALVLGQWTLGVLRGIGGVALLFLKCLAALPVGGIRYRAEIVRQLYSVGVASIPVILTTGAFAGAVFAYTIYNQLASLGVGSWAGAFMAKMLTWHFGPVLIGLVLAGRVGCAMAAELGTMSVTEQTDALRSLGVDPAAYLAMPRVVAALVMSPVLTAFAIFIGLMAGMFMIVCVMGGESHYQWQQIRAIMVPYDYVQGMVKGTLFGLLIALICCHGGLTTRGGAEGVGHATTTANVSTCIWILILNFWISILLTEAEPLWDWLIALVRGT